MCEAQYDSTTHDGLTSYHSGRRSDVVEAADDAESTSSPRDCNTNLDADHWKSL